MSDPILDQGDKLSRQLLGENIQAGTMRGLLFVAVACAVVATFAWAIGP